MKPTDNDEFVEQISNHYILVTLDQSFKDVDYKYGKSGGKLDWFLIIKKDDDTISGATFKDIFIWRENQLPENDLRELIKDPNNPLQPIACIERDHISPEKIQTLAKQNSSSIVCITWCGQIIGILEDKPQTNNESTGVIQKISNIVKLVEDKIKNLQDFSKKWGISILLTIGGFLLGSLLTVIQLKTTNFSEIFPSIFPPVMTGEWNVIVAGFVPSGEQSVSSVEAKYISDVFYNRFSTEMDALGQEASVTPQLIGPGSVPLIKGASPEVREARALELARKTKADIVVYGVISVSGDNYILTPEFSVNLRNFYEIEELVGPHKLGREIELFTNGEELTTQILLNRELSRRSKVMALISKGLGLYLTHHYENALELFQMADDNSLWEYNDGREVVYLFQGNAAGKAKQYLVAERALKKAIESNPEYSRAYAGLGYIYYEHSLENVTNEQFQPNSELLDKSLSLYQQALKIQIEPVFVDLPIRVAFGMGQVYLVKWLAGEDVLTLAKDEFDVVIKAYTVEQNERVQEQAAEAHGMLGLIYREEGELGLALDEYAEAVKLSTNPERRAIHWLTIGDINNLMEEQEGSIAAYQSAIQEYISAIALTTQPIRRADYWVNIADCYKQLQDKDQEKKALQEALSNFPLSAKDREGIEQRLRNLSP